MNADPRGEATLSPPDEIQTASGTEEELTGSPEEELTSSIVPPSVLETLAEQAQEGGNPERRKTLPILPERFSGNLAARYMPADWDKIRKEAKRRARRGDKDDVSFMAYQVAMACEEILIRPKPGADFLPMGEAMGRAPIRFDPDLLTILKLYEAVPGVPEPRPEDCVRVLFRNKEALMAHLQELTAWQREEGDGDDEDDGPDPT